MIGKQEPGNPSNRVSKSKGKSEHFQHHDGIAISSRVCKASDLFRTTFFPVLVTTGCRNSNRANLSSEITRANWNEMRSKKPALGRENTPRFCG